jgi:hypothetical protein
VERSATRRITLDIDIANEPRQFFARRVHRRRRSPASAHKSHDSRDFSRRSQWVSKLKNRHFSEIVRQHHDPQSAASAFVTLRAAAKLTRELPARHLMGRLRP